MALIELRQAGVSFPIFTNADRSLKTALASRLVGGRIRSERGGPVVVEALRGVDLKLVDGARLGVMGHNGAGKTTLLKLIAGIYEPTSGRVIREGRVTALTDLMMGMDWEATGYANIILRGVFLGLTRKQAEALVPAVEAFTELEGFLHLPLRTYSSGMMVRLAFAVCTAIDTDILVMDEIIAAGDASFQQKARRRVAEFIGQARILVVATHSPATMREFCNLGLVLRKGEVQFLGGVEEAIASYAAGEG